MKVLIWVGCLLIASIIRIVIFANSSLGALPTLLLYGACFAGAKMLCVSWDDHKAKRKQDVDPSEPNSHNKDEKHESEQKINNSFNDDINQTGVEAASIPTTSHDYHVNLSDCVLLDAYGNADTFMHEGRIYDRKKFIALEKAALQKLDNRTITEGLMKLRQEKARTPLFGIKAATLEAYEQAILIHPGFHGTILQGELQGEPFEMESEAISTSTELESSNAMDQSAPVQDGSQIRFCRRCGSELPPGSSICHQCGTPIIGEGQIK